METIWLVTILLLVIAASGLFVSNLIRRGSSGAVSMPKSMKVLRVVIVALFLIAAGSLFRAIHLRLTP